MKLMQALNWSPDLFEVVKSSKQLDTLSKLSSSDLSAKEKAALIKVVVEKKLEAIKYVWN